MPCPSDSRTSIAKQRCECRHTGIRGCWQAERSQRGSSYCKTRNRILICGTRCHAESRDHKWDMQAAATAGQSHPVIVVKGCLIDLRFGSSYHDDSVCQQSLACQPVLQQSEQLIISLHSLSIGTTGGVGCCACESCRAKRRIQFGK